MSRPFRALGAPYGKPVAPDRGPRPAWAIFATDCAARSVFVDAFACSRFQSLRNQRFRYGFGAVCGEPLAREEHMSNWLHSLPVLWMAVLVFGCTYLVTAGIYAVVTAFAVGERARSFKAISPGLLSPLGIIFALFIAFTAAQVWTDNEKARGEIDREASALRSATILAPSFPREFQVQLRELIRRYIADVAAQEWPVMAHGTANLRAIPGVLAEALQATLALNPNGEGQKTAQRDIATALETALDARRQRIIISGIASQSAQMGMFVHAGGLRPSCNCHGP